MSSAVCGIPASNADPIPSASEIGYCEQKGQWESFGWTLDRAALDETAEDSPYLQNLAPFCSLNPSGWIWLTFLENLGLAVRMRDIQNSASVLRCRNTLSPIERCLLSSKKRGFCRSSWLSG